MKNSNEKKLSKHQKSEPKIKPKAEKNIKSSFDISEDKLLNRKINRTKDIIKSDKKTKNIYINENLNPKNLKYLTNLSKNIFDGNNNIIVFKSIYNIECLVYIQYNLSIFNNNSIVTYNLNKNEIINIIKNAHKENIYHLEHYLDIQNKRDLILSISQDNSVKIWNFKTFKNILEFNNKDLGNLDMAYYTACFLNHKNNIYILINIAKKNHPIKVYDLKKKNIKNIYINNNNYVEFIENIYDKKLSKNYILIKSESACKSYNYSDDKEYHTYFKSNDCKIIIDNNSEKIRIIGIIRKFLKNSEDRTLISIWDFHSGQKIQKFDVKATLKNLCLWNNQYMICLSIDGMFADKKNILSVIDMNIGKIIKDLFITKEFDILSIIKINHPNYGESLLTTTSEKKLLLWILKDN